ncbi:hypothetical protein OIO90_004009 [Microbotryomycetes sp. JL221]|nr:hypothetical protein OIO90_004009 [Microbotryomycetes sp. JL221]
MDKRWSDIVTTGPRATGAGSWTPGAEAAAQRAESSTSNWRPSDTNDNSASTSTSVMHAPVARHAPSSTQHGLQHYSVQQQCSDERAASGSQSSPGTKPPASTKFGTLEGTSRQHEPSRDDQQQQQQQQHPHSSQQQLHQPQHRPTHAYQGYHWSAPGSLANGNYEHGTTPGYNAAPPNSSYSSTEGSHPMWQAVRSHDGPPSASTAERSNSLVSTPATTVDGSNPSGVHHHHHHYYQSQHTNGGRMPLGHYRNSLPHYASYPPPSFATYQHQLQAQQQQQPSTEAPQTPSTSTASSSMTFPPLTSSLQYPNWPPSQPTFPPRSRSWDDRTGHYHDQQHAAARHGMNSTAPPTHGQHYPHFEHVSGLRSPWERDDADYFGRNGPPPPPASSFFPLSGHHHHHHHVQHQQQYDQSYAQQQQHHHHQAYTDNSRVGSNVENQERENLHDQADDESSFNERGRTQSSSSTTTSIDETTTTTTTTSTRNQNHKKRTRTDLTEDGNELKSKTNKKSIKKINKEEVRRYICIECLKEGKDSSFTRPSALKTHSFVHSKIKEHTCDTCLRSFSVLSNLTRHCNLFKAKINKALEQQGQEAAELIQQQHWEMRFDSHNKEGKGRRRTKGLKPLSSTCLYSNFEQHVVESNNEAVIETQEKQQDETKISIVRRNSSMYIGGRGVVEQQGSQEFRFGLTTMLNDRPPSSVRSILQPA